jgi:transposase-like protein
MPRRASRSANSEPADEEVDEPLYDPGLYHAVLAEAAHERRLSKYKRMGIGQRREMSAVLFARGYTNAEVAREMDIHPDTVTRYRRWYEDSLAEQAKNNPHMLRDVLGNTLRTLEELDRVRVAAWKDYEESVTPTARKGFLDVITKAQSERAKLFGLMGVKQDTLVYINGVKEVQDKLMDFMTKELCPADRTKLETYLVETFQTELGEINTPADMGGS